MKRSAQITAGIVITGLLGAALFAIGHHNARADPVFRRASVALPGWPKNAAPITIALVSDVHLGSSVMDEARLTRVIDQIADARPDLVLFAGDFISGHEPKSAIGIAPGLTAVFRRLRPPLGTIAVLGNHDHWTGPRAVTAALTKAGVTVLENRAVTRGPLAIGGVGDAATRHDRVAQTTALLRRLPGARIMVTHSPDIGGRVPVDVSLLLAGHTHCGQIVLPIVGAVSRATRHRDSVSCGLVRDARRTTIVTAGLGTSILPLRFGAPPDVWLIHLSGLEPRPVAKPAAGPSAGGDGPAPL